MGKQFFRNRTEFQTLISDAHQESGQSLRAVADATGLNFAYIWQVLNGKRHPSRDVVIVLCLCGWKRDLDSTDAILQSVGYKPLQSTSKLADMPM